MRFMCLWRPSANQTQAPSQQMMADMGKLIEDMTKSGVLVSTGGWDPRSPSKIVANRGGDISVKDGPFSEAKEVIAGYALIECASFDEAVEHARRFIKIAGDGTSEVRPLGGPG